MVLRLQGESSVGTAGDRLLIQVLHHSIPRDDMHDFLEVREGGFEDADGAGTEWCSGVENFTEDLEVGLVLDGYCDIGGGTYIYENAHATPAQRSCLQI